ncbi:ABC transporter ATP-binding protein [Micromonospora haikouensis]|uniref:ABC transporter ATP-binding protein n=1 Tax=Micromonospora haikouensis TaxID=686309 RepID=UPI00341A53FB
MTVPASLRMALHTLRLSYRADPRVTCFVGVLVLLQAGLVAATASAQRWLVDAAGARMLAGLVEAVVVGILAYVMQVVGQRLALNFRNDLVNRVQMAMEQEITETAARIPTIEHLERAEFLNQITMLRRGTVALTTTGWAAAYAVSAGVGLCLSVWLLADLHPLLTILVPCALPILVLTNRARKIQQQAFDATAEPLRQEAALHELCLRPGPAKEVRISGNAERLNRLAQQLWTRAAREEGAARLRGLGIEAAGWALYYGALAVTLVLVGHLMASGQTTAGGAVLLISLAGQLRTQQQAVVDAITQVAAGGRIAEHHFWLTRYASASRAGVLPPPTRLTRGIVLDRVSFTYPGTEERVLDEVDLVVPAGCSIAVVGENGAGKSTLIKLLMGVLRPTGGTITVDGVDLTRLDASGWAAASTGTLQDFLKLQVPVRESVGAGDLRKIGDVVAVDGALRRAAAAQFVHELPDGVETLLGRLFGGIELSHGQWQRLAVARGLMRTSPLLLVLDEPTAALDAQSEHDLFELFTRQAREYGGDGAITVLVSHRFSTVHLADRIVVVSGGRVIEQGTHPELLAAGGEYASLYRLQAEAYGHRARPRRHPA